MYKRDWTKELEQKALDELNEIPNKKEEQVKHIKEWLMKQQHLNARTDRQWILNFLRGSKFSTEETKEKLEYLYRAKSTTPEFYSNRDPFLPELQEILKRCIILPHSTKNEELLIVRWADTDANQVSFINLFKYAFMVMDITLIESSSYLVLGYHIIIDMKGFPLSYVKQMSPSVLKKLAYTLVKGYPTRIKGIHVFNASSYFATIFNMFVQFFSKQILEKIKIYDKFDLDELCKYVSISNLPKEYGGSSDSVYDIGARWKTCFESHRDWFLEDEQYKAKEKSNKQRDRIDQFSVDGFFKKLDID